MIANSWIAEVNMTDKEYIEYIMGPIKHRWQDHIVPICVVLSTTGYFYFMYVLITKMSMC